MLSPSRIFFRLGVEPTRRRRLFRSLPALLLFRLRIACVCFESEAMESLSLVFVLLAVHKFIIIGPPQVRVKMNTTLF